jgi:hypothetical protein
LGVLGAILFGVQGASWGAVLATIFGVLVSWLYLRAALASLYRPRRAAI